MKKTFHQAVTAHREGKLEEAERLYRSILENQPTNLDANNNLGVMLYNLGRLDEAEASYRKAIELKPDYVVAHYNLGAVLKDLSRLDEAEASYRKAIELKPDYVAAHNNLGGTLKKLGRFDEAEVSYRKAIELKPDYAEAYNNLGSSLQDLGRLDEAEVSYRKAIALKPDYTEVNKNLDILLKQKRLLSKIEQVKKPEVKTKLNFFKKVSKKLSGSGLKLSSNPFISNLKVEAELISQLYKINSKKLNDVQPKNLHYGNGRTSEYQLFENDFSTIKTVEKDLINIMKEAVKSDIFIMESFFNIFQTGSGITPHNHVTNFDDIHGLLNQKFSLTYYLDTGNQNCSEPGILKLQDPDKEILPSEGMILIFPASRKHSATYNGDKDRVMIGVNFYSLI